MEWLSPVLMVVQVVTSLGIIILVLLQQGKGADMGSSFGAGSAGSLFGSSGAANFLSRTTKWVAVAFFASTGGLAYISHHPEPSVTESGIMQGYTAPVDNTGQGSAVPAAPGAVSGAVPEVPAPPSAASGPSTAASAAGASGAVPSAPPAGESK